VPEKQPDGVVIIETPVPEPPPTVVAVVPDPVETVTYTPAPDSIVAVPPADLQPTPQIVTPPQALVRKIALITGATSGIGKATALEFARNGWNVIITGRRADRLAEFKIALEQQFPTEVLTLCFDIRHNNEVERAVHSIPTAWQEIDVLVNNAGLAKGLAPIQEGNLEHWETMIDTNIKGLLYITRCISPGMVARRRGHIINLSSSAGKEAYPNGGVYCATKFAVEALTRGMRMDLYKHNIRVSQVSPGHVEETEFAITRFDGDAEKAKIYDDFQPLTAPDVAEAIYFMASRPAHVNVQDIWMFGTQQASATMVDRSGR
jgi:NADP-dependent 3-hydroxy acid dehydrogenase YdfG